MEKYLPIIESFLSTEDRRSEIIKLVENLYFLYVINPFKILSFSEEHRCTKDLINLELLLSNPKYTFKVRSKLVQEKLGKRLVQEIAEGKYQAFIERKIKTIIDNLAYIKSAYFITRVIKKSHNDSFFKWFVTVYATIFTLIVTMLIRTGIL